MNTADGPLLAQWASLIVEASDGDAFADLEAASHMVARREFGAALDEGTLDEPSDD
jgi:hypothetical protein